MLFYSDICILEFFSSTNNQKLFSRFARNIPRLNRRRGSRVKPARCKSLRAEFSTLKTGVMSMLVLV